MAKTSAPFASFRASGQVAKSQVHFRRRGRNLVRRYVPYPPLKPVIEVIVVPEMIYHEYDTSPIYVSQVNVWETYNIADYYIEAAQRLDILCFYYGNMVMGTRKNAASGNRTLALNHPTYQATAYLPCEVDEDGNFQLKASSLTAVYFRIMGYWRKE